MMKKIWVLIFIFLVGAAGAARALDCSATAGYQAPHQDWEFLKCVYEPGSGPALAGNHTLEQYLAAVYDPTGPHLRIDAGGGSWPNLNEVCANGCIVTSASTGTLSLENVAFLVGDGTDTLVAIRPATTTPTINMDLRDLTGGERTQSALQILDNSSTSTVFIRNQGSSNASAMTIDTMTRDGIRMIHNGANANSDAIVITMGDNDSSAIDISTSGSNNEPVIYLGQGTAGKGIVFYGSNGNGPKHSVEMVSEGGGTIINGISMWYAQNGNGQVKNALNVHANVANSTDTIFVDRLYPLGVGSGAYHLFNASDTFKPTTASQYDGHVFNIKMGVDYATVEGEHVGSALYIDQNATSTVHPFLGPAVVIDGLTQDNILDVRDNGNVVFRTSATMTEVLNNAFVYNGGGGAAEFSVNSAGASITTELNIMNGSIYGFATAGAALANRYSVAVNPGGGAGKLGIIELKDITSGQQTIVLTSGNSEDLVEPNFEMKDQDGDDLFGVTTITDTVNFFDLFHANGGTEAISAASADVAGVVNAGLSLLNTGGDLKFFAGINGNISASGTVTLGDSASDTITLNGITMLPKLASAPYTCNATWEGAMYYDTTANKSYTCDGTTWQAHW